MFWAFYPSSLFQLSLSPTSLIIEVFVGQCMAPLSCAFKTSDLYKALQRGGEGGKKKLLTTWVVRCRGSERSEAVRDSLSQDEAKLDAFHVPEGRAVCSGDLESIWKRKTKTKQNKKNTIMSLPWNQFECWPPQCCNYLGHADTFACSVHWTCARCSEHLQKQFYFWGKMCRFAVFFVLGALPRVPIARS